MSSYGDCLTVFAEFVTIDLKGYAIFSPNRFGTAINGFGRGLVVRGGTICNFGTGIHGGDGLVVEQMRLVSNLTGVDGGGAGAITVKDSVVSDNSQWGVSLAAGSVTGNSFTRNGTGVVSGSGNPYPYPYPSPSGSSSVTIANNTFSQNNLGIQAQGPASIQNNMIEGGYGGLTVTCPARVVGNTVVRAGTPVSIQSNNVWDCTFEQNSIRQF
jgi:hypothetical protein